MTDVIRHLHSRRTPGLALLACVSAALCVAPAVMADGDAGQLTKERAEAIFPAKAPYSPYSGRNYPTRPLFGDTHLHTSFSMDAGAAGARLTPDDAYRFAKGEQVMASSGQPVEAVASPRFPRGGRSLGRLRLLPAADERRPDAAGH